MIRHPLVVCAALSLVPGCALQPPHPAVGRTVGPLPVVSVADPRIPAPGLEGRVTLLNFWGTWCPPCRRELPGLVRLARRLAAEPAFQLVAVSCAGGAEGDGDDLAVETRRFLSAQRLDLDAWRFDDPIRAAVFSTALGLDALPATYLVDRDARVVRVWVGYRSSDEAEIAAAVAATLRAAGP